MGSPTDPDAQLILGDWKFGMVTQHKVFNGSFDALIGFAFPEFAEPGVVPLFDGLMNSGKLNKDVHSWYISQNPDEQSEILLGGWDTDKYTGDIEWHDVTKRLFWSMKLDDIKVGGKSTGFCTRSGANCTVTPDSGTSLLTFPEEHNTIFQSYYGGKTDCIEGEELQFPELTYVIGGIDYVVPSHHWVRRKIDKDSSKGGVCENSITALGVG